MEQGAACIELEDRVEYELGKDEILAHIPGILRNSYDGDPSGESHHPNITQCVQVNSRYTSRQRIS